VPTRSCRGIPSPTYEDGIFIKREKPPKGYKIPLEASHRHLHGTLSHSPLQKFGLQLDCKFLL
jgi:hypothetical protein